MRHAGFLHYHLAGSDPDGAVMGSNNLMMWTAAELAFDQGLGRLHLGGGRAESDGLARFKSTFGAETRDFHVGRAIIDSEAYSRLTRARTDQLGTTCDALENADYFPAFRASVG
ncbi:MAG: family N-acetyltransferase [Mycobacterium sp.]|nr:family N-acetyltransferase [Mycobacterium sp.]